MREAQYLPYRAVGEILNVTRDLVKLATTSREDLQQQDRVSESWEKISE